MRYENVIFELLDQRKINTVKAEIVEIWLDKYWNLLVSKIVKTMHFSASRFRF